MIKVINWEIHWTLDMPPSMNKLFAWKSRRYKSEDYEWFTNYVFVMFINNDEKINITWDEWLEIDYTFYFSLYTLEWKKRKKDTWNFEKALTDCLCKNIEWFEDHKILDIHLHKRDSDKNIVKFIIRETHENKL